MASKRDGKWRARWRDENNVLRSKTCDDYRTAKYIEDTKKVEVAEIRRGIRSPTPKPRKWEELRDTWLDKRASGKRSEKDDRSIIGQLDRYFRSMLLADIIHGTAIDDCRSGLRKKGLAPKTIRNHLSLLKTMLKTAKEDWRWILEVPKVKLPKVSLVDEDYRYLQKPEDIEAFLKAAAAQGPVVYAMYATGLYTGARAGELAGLKRRHVDLGRRLIHVRRSYDGPTKNGKPRVVPILDALLPILQHYLELNTGEWVFPNRDGRMHRPSSRIFQEVLHRVLDEAGFSRQADGKRVITFHGLRHTFASHWMMRGGNIYRLQNILGHSSVAMTIRYAHLAPEVYVEDYARFGGPVAEPDGAKDPSDPNSSKS